MITKAEYIKDYQIKVYFTDGTIKAIDLFGFLSASTHPLINKYLDIELFKQFSIDSGVICWGDNEFDLNPETIYKGRYYAKPDKISKDKKDPNAETLKAISEISQGKGKRHKTVDSLMSDLMAD